VLRARQAEDAGFPVIPVLHGLTRDDLRQDPALAWLDGQHPVEPDRDSAERATWHGAAQQALEAALPRRMARDDPPAPLTCCLRTFHYTPPAAHLHLDLDWTTLFPREASPPPEVWRTTLLPTLDGVRRALAAQPLYAHGLNFWLKARLPAAVALGHTFPNRLAIPLYFHRSDQAWDAAAPSGATLEIAPAEEPPEITRPDAVVLELAINIEIADHVRGWRTAQNFQPRRRLHCAAQPQSDRAITSEEQAREWAARVRAAVLPLWNRPEPTELHLFMAGPVEFAALVAQGLNLGRPLYVYEWDGGAATYRVTAILGYPG
jgi:hypothetical protein